MRLLMSETLYVMPIVNDWSLRLRGRSMLFVNVCHVQSLFLVCLLCAVVID